MQMEAASQPSAGPEATFEELIGRYTSRLPRSQFYKWAPIDQALMHAYRQQFPNLRRGEQPVLIIELSGESCLLSTKASHVRGKAGYRATPWSAIRTLHWIPQRNTVEGGGVALTCSVLAKDGPTIAALIKEIIALSNGRRAELHVPEEGRRARPSLSKLPSAPALEPRRKGRIWAPGMVLGLLLIAGGVSGFMRPKSEGSGLVSWEVRTRRGRVVDAGTTIADPTFWGIVFVALGSGACLFSVRR